VPETPETPAYTRDTPDPGYMGHPVRQSVFGWLKWTCGLWECERGRPGLHADLFPHGRIFLRLAGTRTASHRSLSRCGSGDIFWIQIRIADDPDRAGDLAECFSGDLEQT